MSTKAIHLAGVGKHFARGKSVTHALEAIDLTIKAGEFVAVVGHQDVAKVP